MGTNVEVAMSGERIWRSMNSMKVDKTPAHRDPSITGMISEIARTAPHRSALEADHETLDYGALEQRANRLAHHLRGVGVGVGDVVGICLERSFDQIIVQLAILKTGAAFLPLDPGWPVQRLVQVLDDAGARVVVGHSVTVDRLAGGARIALALDSRVAAIAAEPVTDPGIAPSGDALAYVIYTSGSTGVPKGVEITHDNLLNLIAWHRACFAITPTDRAGHVAGLGFDAAVWEIWPHLCAGATLVLAREAVRGSAALLQDWLVEHAITVAFVPTPLAEPMIVEPWPDETMLRVLLTGGDTLHCRPRPGLPFKVWNNYGPTECTVVATSGEISPAVCDALPSIGAPIGRSQVHLLDAQGREVEDGALGEIHIGGANVGRGYRNRPDLTAERFVPDPFGPPGARLYRTGDLGAWLPDGTLAFHGRIDDQEKIRGHRVEPDEVARALDRHAQVGSSAVVARGEGADRHLVAYVVPTGEVPSAETLRDFLGELLPDYMIPAEFVRLDALPLTSSGKLDRRALPVPGPDNGLDRQAFRAPQTPTELRLAGIVAELLGVAEIGADDNFFLLGGHSLLGTQVVLRAREAFGVELSLRHLFEAETVATLAEVVERLLIEKLETMTDEEAGALATR